jgi:hypothetical protein
MAVTTKVSNYDSSFVGWVMVNIEGMYIRMSDHPRAAEVERVGPTMAWRRHTALLLIGCPVKDRCRIGNLPTELLAFAITFLQDTTWSHKMVIHRRKAQLW